MDYPVINIIHHLPRSERLPVLFDELRSQGIKECEMWESIHAPTTVGSINFSHKQVVQLAKENELSEVLICEDDVQFSDKGSFEYFIMNKPKDYDIYLAGIFLGNIKEDNTVKQFTGMTLYFVHQNFYNTFLNTDADKHIDHSLAGLGKYIVCNPMVVRQHNGYSDNEKSHQNYDLIFKNKKLYKHE